MCSSLSLLLAVLVCLVSADRQVTPKQAVVCDACLRSAKIRDCDSYVPDAALFDHSRPAPAKPIGIWVCEPSELELWTTDGRFKVGDDAHPPGVVSPCESRRVAWSEGHLSTARRFCKDVKKHQTSPTMSKCSDLMHDIAPSSQGRDVDCSMRNWNDAALLQTNLMATEACSTGYYGPDCSIEEKCAHPTENNCNFYLDCLESHKHCDVTTRVSYPKCQEYQTLEPSLTAEGQKWSQHVRVCIGQQMAQHVLLPKGSDFECPDLEKSFFEDHLPCYTDGPISFCDLPLHDSARVLWHASSIMWSGFLGKATVAGTKLLAKCGMQSFAIDTDYSEPSDEFAMDFSNFQNHFELLVATAHPSHEGSAIMHDGRIHAVVRRKDGQADEIDDEAVHQIVGDALSFSLGGATDIKYSINGKSRARSSAVSSLSFDGPVAVVGAAVGVAAVSMGAVAMWMRHRQDVDTMQPTQWQ